jgi:hypothetical protein
LAQRSTLTRSLKGPESPVSWKTPSQRVQLKMRTPSACILQLQEAAVAARMVQLKKLLLRDGFDASSGTSPKAEAEDEQSSSLISSTTALPTCGTCWGDLESEASTKGSSNSEGCVELLLHAISDPEPTSPTAQGIPELPLTRPATPDTPMLMPMFLELSVQAPAAMPNTGPMLVPLPAAPLTLKIPFGGEATEIKWTELASSCCPAEVPPPPPLFRPLVAPSQLACETRTPTSCETRTKTSTDAIIPNERVRKWAVILHWCLVRDPAVQGAVLEVAGMQLERYRKTRREAKGRQWSGKNATECAYFDKLAKIPEQNLSLGTLACCKGEACNGCWKTPRWTSEGGTLIQRRSDRICVWGTLCKYCHCHLRAKPNRSKKDREIRQTDLVACQA